MCVELMLNAVNLQLRGPVALHGGRSGRSFVVFVMTVAAAEAAVGLAIVIAVFRHFRRSTSTHQPAQGLRCSASCRGGAPPPRRRRPPRTAPPTGSGWCCSCPLLGASSTGLAARPSGTRARSTRSAAPGEHRRAPTLVERARRGPALMTCRGARAPSATRPGEHGDHTKRVTRTGRTPSRAASLPRLVSSSGRGDRASFVVAVPRSPRCVARTPRRRTCAPCGSGWRPGSLAGLRAAARPAVDADDARHHGRRHAHPPVQRRLHARRPRGTRATSRT
jgi:hypothetical protein